VACRSESTVQPTGRFPSSSWVKDASFTGGCRLQGRLPLYDQNVFAASRCYQTLDPGHSHGSCLLLYPDRSWTLLENQE
jgi:hypothetical protein